MRSNKRKYLATLIIYSLALLTILTFLPVNDVYAETYELKNLPSGGYTIIIGDIAYSKQYLEGNTEILTEALYQGKTVYVKLAEEIFIDQKGQLLSDITKIPQITKYFNEINETEFMVISIY